MSYDDPKAHEQLRLSEASFRALIDDSPDALVVHRHGRFVYVNRRCVELLGYSDASELLGQPVTSIVHPDHHAAVTARIRALEDAPSVPFSEERLVRRDGASVTVEISRMRAMFQGEPAIVAIARDLSERRRRNAEVAQAERMAAIGLLAAGVAHEINNPLTFVTLHLENLARNVNRLRKEPTVPKADQWDLFAKAVEEARFGLERVGSIVRDLRTFARHEDGEPDLVSIASVLDTAVNLTAHELKYRAKVARIGEESQAYVIGREGKLCQVFVNLLVNAAQALSAERSDTNEVSILTEVDGESVRILVSDNGPGIPPLLHETLFEPFVTSKGSGSGLGLAICRDIVMAHQGTIDVRSTEGGGATFCVVLPHARDSGIPRSSRNLISNAPPVVRSRVLVIDDEPSIVQLVGGILSETYDLEVAASAAEAQERLATDRKFDLILCDVMMPRLSGIQFHAWVEREVPALAVRVLFMTGGDLGPGGRELIERSPDRFLAKPFTRAQLEARVAGAIAKRRTH